MIIIAILFLTRYANVAPLGSSVAPIGLTVAHRPTFSPAVRKGRTAYKPIATMLPAPRTTSRLRGILEIYRDAEGNLRGEMWDAILVELLCSFDPISCILGANIYN